MRKAKHVEVHGLAFIEFITPGMATD